MEKSKSKEEQLTAMALDELINFLNLNDKAVMAKEREVLQTYFMKARIALQLRKEEGIRQRSAVSVIRMILPLMNDVDRTRYIELLRLNMPREYKALPSPS